MKIRCKFEPDKIYDLGDINEVHDFFEDAVRFLTKDGLYESEKGEIFANLKKFLEQGVLEYKCEVESLMRLARLMEISKDGYKSSGDSEIVAGIVKKVKENKGEFFYTPDDERFDVTLVVEGELKSFKFPFDFTEFMEFLND